MSTWSTIAQTVNTSSGCKNLKASGISYGIGPIGEFFVFCAIFDDIAPLVFSGYVEVKDGPKLNAFIYSSENMLEFIIIPLTLEQYRKRIRRKTYKTWMGRRRIYNNKSIHMGGIKKTTLNKIIVSILRFSAQEAFQ